MMSNDSLREWIKAALQRAAMAPDRSQPLRLLDETAEAYADAALAAIEASGPTGEMIEAGIASLGSDDDRPAASIVYDCWKAMWLAARPRDISPTDKE